MSLTRENILKLERSLANADGKISKSEKISKATAEELLYDFAGSLQAEDASLSKEKAFALAMTKHCPTLGGIAAS